MLRAERNEMDFGDGLGDGFDTERNRLYVSIGVIASTSHGVALSNMSHKLNVHSLLC